MTKKGTSIIELIAVIVIMGVVASIATVTTISLVQRQRKNVTVNSLNNIFETAKQILYQAKLGTHDDFIHFIDEDFCYVSLTDMIDNGSVEGNNFKPIGNEIYFCYDMDINTWALIGNSVNKTKPSETGTTEVNKVNITFDYANSKFKKA